MAGSVLYVTHSGGGVSDTNLYTVDIGDMSVTAVGDTGHFFTGLAFDPTDTTKFYGVTGNAGSDQKTLFLLDPLTGAASLIGALGTTIANISFDSTGQLYGFKVSNRRLCTIDKATGTVVEVGSSGLSSSSGNGLACDPSDTFFWLFPQGNNGDIYNVDKITGAATDVGVMFPVVGSSTTVGSAAFGPSDVLYGLGVDTGTVFTVGAFAAGTWPQSLVGDLPASDDPWDGMAWLVGDTPPPPDSPGAGPYATTRVFVTDIDARTLSILDRRSTDKQFLFPLNAPAYHTGQVASDDPEVNLPFPDADSQANLSHNSRLIYALQRWPGYTPPYQCIFGGIVTSVEDQGSDAPTTRYTASDPWQYMMSRPYRNPDDGALLTEDYTFPTGTRASEIAVQGLSNTEVFDGETHIDTDGTGYPLVENTDPLPGPFTVSAGSSLGEVWTALCETGTIDIHLPPIYDPEFRPGKVCEFQTVKQALGTAAGPVRHGNVMAWDKPGNSLMGVNRLVDGTRLANKIAYFTGTGVAVPVQTDADSVTLYGRYWAQQFFPGTNDQTIIALLAFTELLLRRNGARSISCDPAPERVEQPFKDYGLGDYLPVWASRNLREPLGVDYDAFDPDNPGASGYMRIYAIPLTVDDNGVSRVTGLLMSKEN